MGGGETQGSCRWALGALEGIKCCSLQHSADLSAPHPPKARDGQWSPHFRNLCSNPLGGGEPAPIRALF